MANAKTYRIETERLTIRCFAPHDAQLLLNAIEASKEHLSAWMPWANAEHLFDDKLALVRQFRGEFDMGIDYKFGIFNKEQTQLVGSAGLHTRVGEGAREIGYWINAGHTNKGYAFEAAAALTRIAFEIEDIKRVEIHCAPENEYSMRIPKKLGFHLDGILRSRTTDGSGVEKDRMIWTMFAGEYQTSIVKTAEITAFDILDREIIVNNN